MGKKSKFMISRRGIIQASGVGAAASFGKMNFFANSLFNSLFNEAMAQELGILDKKYVYIQEPGAPSTWYFKCPLRPDGDTAKFEAAPQVGTRYTGGARYTGLEYATTNVDGVEMPWVWQFPIAVSGGGKTPMSNLAREGLLIMRGTNTNNPAHAAARALHFQPLGITTTLTALAADVSDYPIGGVNLSASSYKFASKKGLSSVRLSNNGNMVNSLMQPFNMPDLGSFATDSQRVAVALESSRSALDAMAKVHNPNADIVKKSTDSAINLLNKDFGDLNTVFNNLVNKYKDLINRSIDPNQNLPGINDKPVGITGNRDDTYRYGTDDIVNIPDLRDMITSATNVDRMASQFATAEFTLLNNISSSVTLNPGGLRNLSLGDGVRNSQFFDEHSAGSMVTLMIHTYYHLAMSSCIYELVKQLKTAGMWQHTVIDLCGEFARCPKNDGTGADHSAQANSACLFSGNVDGLHVVGDIVNDGQGRNGTWGTGDGSWNLGTFTAAFAHILGVQSPITAATSIMQPGQNGKLIPGVPMGKNVS